MKLTSPQLPVGNDLARLIPALYDELRRIVRAVNGTDDLLTGILGGGMGTMTVPIAFRNKIINGLFSINQRGYTSGAATTAANQYTLDRWRVVTSGQNVSWVASGNGASVTAPAGGLEQVIEGSSIEGGVYTLSWVGTATATVNGAAIANGGQTATLAAGADVTVRFSGGTVKEAQFERGSIATPFEQRPLGLELSLCQRYFFAPHGDYIGSAKGTSAIAIFVPFPVRMRALPDVTLTNNVNVTGECPWWTGFVTAPLATIAVHKGLCSCGILVEGFSGLIDGKPAMLPGSYFHFDAEL